MKPINYRYSEGGKILIDNEIKKLCDSEVLEQVQVKNDVNEVPFILPIFTRVKKDQSTRMILNLKILNQSVEYNKFKMDTSISDTACKTRMFYGVHRSETGIL